jgi:hypothetical protein
MERFYEGESMTYHEQACDEISMILSGFVPLGFGWTGRTPQEFLTDFENCEIPRRLKSDRYYIEAWLSHLGPGEDWRKWKQGALAESVRSIRERIRLLHAARDILQKRRASHGEA